MKTSTSNCLGINGGEVLFCFVFHLLRNRIGGRECQQECIKIHQMFGNLKDKVKGTGSSGDKNPDIKDRNTPT